MRLMRHSVFTRNPAGIKLSLIKSFGINPPSHETNIPHSKCEYQGTVGASSASGDGGFDWEDWLFVVSI